MTFEMKEKNIKDIATEILTLLKDGEEEGIFISSFYDIQRNNEQLFFIKLWKAISTLIDYDINLIDFKDIKTKALLNVDYREATELGDYSIQSTKEFIKLNNYKTKIKVKEKDSLQPIVTLLIYKDKNEN